MDKMNRLRKIKSDAPQVCLVSTPPKRQKPQEMPDNGNAPRKQWPSDSKELVDLQLKRKAVSSFE
jgi:hypothetical protein